MLSRMSRMIGFWRYPHKHRREMLGDAIACQYPGKNGGGGNDKTNYRRGLDGIHADDQEPLPGQCAVNHDSKQKSVSAG